MLSVKVLKKIVLISTYASVLFSFSNGYCFDQSHFFRSDENFFSLKDEETSSESIPQNDNFFPNDIRDDVENNVGEDVVNLLEQVLAVLQEIQNIPDLSTNFQGQDDIRESILNLLEQISTTFQKIQNTSDLSKSPEQQEVFDMYQVILQDMRELLASKANDKEVRTRIVQLLRNLLAILEKEEDRSVYLFQPDQANQTEYKLPSYKINKQSLNKGKPLQSNRDNSSRSSGQSFNKGKALQSKKDNSLRFSGQNLNKGKALQSNRDNSLRSSGQNLNKRKNFQGNGYNSSHSNRITLNRVGKR
ncbi:MAG: hypothetical protein LBI95_03415 [Holosporales bacterium]|jgi:hypothetical protein|nr:hypothetical protein [Holosporales bacterium]